MKWVKGGVVFAPQNNFDWMVSHASLPVVDRADEGRLRIYFGARDGRGRSHPGYVEVDAADPRRVLAVGGRPVLPLGRPGTFDDNGIMPSWLVDCEGRKYLYYIGWNPQVTVSYRLSIGLAISEDGGRTFSKASEGPILDRDLDEPFFNTAPCVLRCGETWRMWYVSCTGWETIEGRAEPRYHVKDAVSSDGLHWRRTGRVAIDYDDRTDAIGRPCVWREGDGFRMLFSFRRLRGYRSDPRQSYRLGYAESADGACWARKDHEAGIDRSPEGWDSEMIEYCQVYRRDGRTYLFYNGNGFGRTGFGYAVLDPSGDAPC